MPALQNKEIDIFNPSTVNLSIVQTANQVPNTTKVTLPGLEFEHFDFNQADPYLAKLQVREAIAHGVNRQSIILRTVGEIRRASRPLGSRMLMSTQKGYKGTPYAFSTSSPMNLMKEAGLQEGLGRLLPARLRSAEGPGPDVHHSVDVGQHHPLGDGGAVPGADEGDRDKNQHPELRRQHLLRDQPAERHVPDRRVRLGHHTVRLG